MRTHSRQPWRLLGAAALVLSVAACGQNDVLQPTPPSPPAAPPPAPPAPPPPTGGVTLSGTVLAFTDSGERRPVPNLRLKVRDGGTTDGAVRGIDLPDTVTDANGRYTIDNVSAYILFFQTAPGSDYRFLCDAYPVDVKRGFGLNDLPVVHTSWAGNLPPRGLSVPGTSIYGTVSERVDGTLRPVTGATVTLDGGNWDPPATTNAAGFYMICSVTGTDQYRDLAAHRIGFNPVTRQIFGGWDGVINVEMTRR